MSQFLDQLLASPMPDGEQWCIQNEEGFRYESDVAGVTIIVPHLFITDYASVPRLIWAILPPWGRWGAAATIHDWLYWTRGTTRAVADTVLLEASYLLGVDRGLANEIYQAVHTFGESAWNHNAGLKGSGHTRMASGRSVPPYASIL